MYTCILYTAVVMYMCTAGLTAAAHVYTLYALYPYTMYSDHACNMYTFYTQKYSNFERFQADVTVNRSKKKHIVMVVCVF